MTNKHAVKADILARLQAALIVLDHSKDARIPHRERTTLEDVVTSQIETVIAMIEGPIAGLLDQLPEPAEDELPF